MELQPGIVAILNNKNNIVGTGFLAGDRLILTCAHVIEQATGGLNEHVTIRFAVDGSEVIAQVESFSPSYEQDVALLRVSQMPANAQILRLGNARTSIGRDFCAFGYASVGKLQGIGARGPVIDVVDNGTWLQLRSQEIDHGMSGGPVVDESQGAVIGMVSWGKTALERKRNADTSLALSVEAIRALCPELPAPGKIANPFGQRGRIEDPAHYFARQPITREVLDELRKRQSVSIVGETQSGKSSLLWYLTQMGPQLLNLPADDFAYFDLQLVRSEDDFFEFLCETLGVKTCRGYRLGQALRGRHIFLCLDEMEKMTWQGFTQDIRSELRGLADGSGAPLTLVIASRSPLARIFADAPDMTSPLAGLCTQLSFQPFTFKEAVELVRFRLRRNRAQPARCRYRNGLARKRRSGGSAAKGAA